MHRKHDLSGRTARDSSVFLRPNGVHRRQSAGPGSTATGTLGPNDSSSPADHGAPTGQTNSTATFTQVTLADDWASGSTKETTSCTARTGPLALHRPHAGSGQNADPAKELKFNGVYRLTRFRAAGAPHLELTYPNGLAFSPDERHSTCQLRRKGHLDSHDIHPAARSGMAAYSSTPRRS
jgi:gluconolactonase